MLALVTYDEQDDVVRSFTKVRQCFVLFFKWHKMAITIIYLPCYTAVKVRLCSKGTQ